MIIFKIPKLCIYGQKAYSVSQISTQRFMNKQVWEQEMREEKKSIPLNPTPNIPPPLTHTHTHTIIDALTAYLLPSSTCFISPALGNYTFTQSHTRHLVAHMLN